MQSPRATAFHPNLRICECQEERQARLEREQARRAAPPKRTLHEVIAPESKGACTRFPMGKCPMNVKGKRCNRSHSLEEAWRGETCTIPCAFPRIDDMPPAKRPKSGKCALGGGCQYLHKCAAHSRSPPRPNSVRRAHITFDSTLGYP
eukprot:scaffold186480_cov36-Tisochrysis_lutea.AAC.1